MTADPYNDSPSPGPRVIADNDAERYVLGAMLHGRKVLDDPDTIIDPADFHAPRHETIAATVLEMHGRGAGVDPITVAAELLRTGVLKNAGGAPYLADLYGAPVAVSNAAYYARIVRDKATLRRLHIACTQGAQTALSMEGDPADVVETVRAQIDAVQHHDSATVTMVGQEIDAYIDDLEAQTPAGIPTSWPDLNHLIRGWTPGRLYVIGARPSVGKSIMGLQTALGLARHGHVGFYSLEMPRAEVMNRLVAQTAGIPLDDIEARHLDEAQWGRVSKARGAIGEMPLSIDDRAVLRPVDIRAHARTLSRRGPLAGLVVDYLQLMTAARGDQRKRWEQVGEWSRLLKLLAKELGVPVVVLSQLNREIEHRADPKPTLADLRESGSIEQDADVVILLHPVKPDAGQDDPDFGDTLVGVAKNRQGRTGAFTLRLRGEYARFESKARPFTPTSTPSEERYR